MSDPPASPASPARQPPPGPPRRPRRPALAARIALVTTAVVVVAILVAGVISAGLVVSAGQQQARRALGRQADLVQLVADRQHGFAPRPIRALREQGIRVARVSRTGKLRGDRLASEAATPVVRDVLAGRSRDRSYRQGVDGHEVYVEARPLRAGGAVVIVQTVTTAAGQVRGLVARTLLALGIGLVVAVAAGLLLAWRLAAPLRRAASAAHDLAEGRRDVRVRPDGPAEVAEVAEALNVLSDALTVSEGRQREFLLSVSHELRTPLTAIKGFAEALDDGVATGDDAQLAGRTILAEADRLDRLVADVLDLARLGAQDFRIEPTRVDLTDLLDRAGVVWAARCAAVGVPFSTELPERPVVVVTDPGRLRQIVDNLAENALRVTPADRPIVFALRAEPGGPASRGRPVAVVEVRDGGPGLTPEDMAVAFQRSVLYERYRGVRRVGTGVGLALVDGLARRLGGAAHAGRAVEGGAVFTVVLPLPSPP